MSRRSPILLSIRTGGGLSAGKAAMRPALDSCARLGVGFLRETISAATATAGHVVSTAGGTGNVVEGIVHASLRDGENGRGTISTFGETLDGDASGHLIVLPRSDGNRPQPDAIVTMLDLRATGARRQDCRSHRRNRGRSVS